MTCDVNELKKDIRIALDRDGRSQPLIEGDVDSLAVDDIIESKIEEAARIVEMAAPLHRLESGKAFGESIAWMAQEKGRGGGYVVLPQDFMRLLSFRMSDWTESVTEAINEQNPKYRLMGSRYAGIRGNAQKPVVAIVQYPIGNVLEFYGSEQGRDAYIRHARYMPVPKIENGTIEISSMVKQAVVYCAASMTAATLNETALAELLLNQSKEMMQ